MLEKIKVGVSFAAVMFVALCADSLIEMLFSAISLIG